MSNRLYVLFAVFLLCLPLSAQQNDFSAFLAETAGKTVEMKLKVTAVNKSKSQNVSGFSVLKYQDGKYSVTSDGIILKCDGKTQWTVIRPNKEVVIETAPDINMSNPSDLLSVCGINPSKADIDVRYSSSGMLEKVSASLEDGTVITIDIVSVSFSGKTDPKDFVYDTSKLGKSWVVTDLR